MKKLTICSILTIFFVCPAILAWAAEGGEGSAAAAWMDFGWRVLNFIIFAAIIYKIAGKPMKNFFSGRREQISNQLDDLESRKNEAEKKLKEVENSIANIDQERQEILENARQQGEAIRESIIAKAHESAEKIKQQAEVKASQEMQQVLDELRAEMADKIINSAEKIIVSRLDKKEQEKLIDEYLTKVVVN